jgi:hypothetical protein
LSGRVGKNLPPDTPDQLELKWDIGKNWWWIVAQWWWEKNGHGTVKKKKITRKYINLHVNNI